MTQAIIEKVHEHIRRELKHSRDLDELKPGAHLHNDLHAADLDRLQLVMELEDEWSITITDEEAAGLCTVGDVEKLVLAKLAEMEGAI